MLISSAQNSRVKAAARLRDRSGRDDQGRIIIDGVREIGRALAAGVRVIELYCFSELCRDDEHQRLLALADKAGVERMEVTPHVMEKLAYGQRVEGMVAVAEPPQRTLAALALPAAALVAVVEGVEKPGNLGAIVRTADAAGLQAVIVADGRTDIYNPNAIRASLGALFTLPVVPAASDAALEWLTANQFQVFAARVDGELNYTAANYLGRAAIVLGNEARGLSEQWSSPAIKTVRLPMLGAVDSLNLSATAAVLFYEALRQRSV